MTCLTMQRDDVHVQPTAYEYQRLVRAIQGTSDGLWEWDILADTVWYAPCFLELLGYSREEFPDSLDIWASRVHPDDYEPTWAAVQSHLAGGDPYDVRYRLLTKSGNYSWF